MCVETSTMEIPWHAYVRSLSDTMASTMNAPLDPPKTLTSEQYIMSAIETLGDTLGKQIGEMSKRLERMDERFETMVSQVEFKAEIKRIDRERELVAKDVDHLGAILRTEREKSEQQRKDDRSEVQAEFDRKQNKTRWFVGVFTSSIAIAATIVFGVLNALGK